MMILVCMIWDKIMVCLGCDGHDQFGLVLTDTIKNVDSWVRDNALCVI